MTVTLERSVEEFIGSPRQLFINGQWVDAASGRTFDTPNPATGETLARVAEGDAEDIVRAVRAARKAFEEGPWSRMTPSERGRIIWRIGDLILAHVDELAQLESLDNGKPFAVAQAADVPLAADLFHYMAGWATKIEGSTIDISVPYMPGANFHSYTLREPIGVVGQIIPWNFPLLMAAWKLGPALATGNSRGAQAGRADAVDRAAAGRADGRGRGARWRGERGARVRRDRRRGAGLAHGRGQGRVHRLHRGRQADRGRGRGQQPEEADPGAGRQEPEHRVRRRPGRGDRGRRERDLLQPRPVLRGRVTPVRAAEPVSRRSSTASREIAKSIKMGAGMEQGTQMGPLVSDEQFQRVTGFLASGKDDGATALAGGGRFGDRGYFIEPTVLTNTTPDMKVVREEIFGPVLVASPFSDLDEIAAVAQRFGVRPRRRHLDQGHLQGPRAGQETAGRHRLDQLLQRLRRRPALRWLQAVRLGPRDGPRSTQQLHRGQGSHHPALTGDSDRPAGPPRCAGPGIAARCAPIPPELGG